MLTAEFGFRLVNIVEVLFAFTSGFGLLLLWSERRFRGLCVLLAVIATVMIFNVYEELHVARDIYLITPALTLAPGPAFYLFVRQIVYASHPWQRQDVVHFVPTIVALTITEYPQFSIALGTLSELIYWGLSLVLLRRYHRGAKEMSSNTDSQHVYWIAIILALLMCLELADLVRQNLQPYLSFEFRNTWYLFSQLCSLLIVVYMVFKALKQPSLFNELELYEQRCVELKSTKASVSVLISIFKSIESELMTNKHFLQPRLSLSELSTIIGLQEKDISAAINEVYGKSFSDYINHYRVKTLKEILDRKNSDVNNDQQLTLLDLAFSVGFSSKSSFNAAFKRELSLTPTQYIKQNR
ncbi:MAG: AraC-like DNA-binding protein [Flavobacteriales bacterium]|jgi:AraC-like DNA-binding protein